MCNGQSQGGTGRWCQSEGRGRGDAHEHEGGEGAHLSGQWWRGEVGASWRQESEAARWVRRGGGATGRGSWSGWCGRKRELLIRESTVAITAVLVGFEEDEVGGDFL